MRRYTRCLRGIWDKARRWAAVSAALSTAGLSGCLMHTHNVQKVQVVQNLKTASLTDLVNGINSRAAAIQSFSMTVNIAASAGGVVKGSVTNYTSFTGYILLRKPDSLRVLGLLPVIHTKAFDMASNGKTFKLLIPAKNKAVEGPDKIERPSANPLENLRPYVFSQALLVGPVDASEFTYLAGETILVPVPKSKIVKETQDYDVGVLHRRDDSNQLLPSRIVHIDRSSLLPSEQDVYDDKGTVETQAFYSNYQDFSGIPFPMTIRINRPQEEYELTLTVTKLHLNEKLNDDQFDLKFPPDMKVQYLK